MDGTQVSAQMSGMPEIKAEPVYEKRHVLLRLTVKYDRDQQKDQKPKWTCGESADV